VVPICILFAIKSDALKPLVNFEISAVWVLSAAFETAAIRSYLAVTAALSLSSVLANSSLSYPQSQH
jgi:hypothetical protein